jgi:hypothetical protein
MDTDEMPKKGKCSVPCLAVLWQTSIARLSVETEKKPLTPRQFGQLKLLRNGLGDITWAVIDWALNNWWWFSQAARACAGLPCAPATPHIGFLLAHYDVAVNRMVEIAKQTNTVGSAEFLEQVDRLVFDQLKHALQEDCEGHPEWLAKIDAATTTEQLSQLINDSVA